VHSTYGGAVSIGSADAPDGWPTPRVVGGRAARALGFVYVAGSIGCIAALVTIWIRQTAA
jgi:hypothetical protein